MKILQVRNVHEALPRAIRLLRGQGTFRESRYGRVIVISEPVATVYEHPRERVLFWPQRDANPFFHFAECLWILAGRNDVEFVKKYAANMSEFSDDGVIFHGAYGHRLLKHFGKNQLESVIQTLKKDPTDRRCVLQLWDPQVDLGRTGKDLPCNLTMTVQVNPYGRLDLTVFCRSNDIIWGCLGANAVHFSFLQEYLATRIGVPMGVYTQISVNYHAYLKTLEPLKFFDTEVIDKTNYIENPYTRADVRAELMPASIDGILPELLIHESTGFTMPRTYHSFEDNPWTDMAYTMLRAHHAYRTYGGENKYKAALEILKLSDTQIDWIQAGIQWLERRLLKHSAKPGSEAVQLPSAPSVPTERA